MIPIDKGIPMPDFKPRGARAIYPWRTMDVGDSFLIKGKTLSDVRANIAGIEGRMNARFRAAPVKGKRNQVRVWRVE